MVGIIDPPRPEARVAIGEAQSAGLRILMITGDHPRTALRIASELAGFPGITVVMPGGFVRWEALSVVGPPGDGLFHKVNVQKAFMGAAGFTLASGLSDATPEEAEIKRLMVAGAHEVIEKPDFDGLEAVITGLVVGAVIATRPDLVYAARPLLAARELEIRNSQGAPA